MLEQVSVIQGLDVCPNLGWKREIMRIMGIVFRLHSVEFQKHWSVVLRSLVLLTEGQH